jgi:hypothetical protein
VGSNLDSPLTSCDACRNGSRSLKMFTETQLSSSFASAFPSTLVPSPSGPKVTTKRSSSCKFSSERKMASLRLRASKSRN